MQTKMKTMVLTSIFASLYAAITLVFQPISFLTIQVRVSGALIFLLPVFPIPVLVGVSIGVLLANLVSPLGAIDLVSAVVTFVSMLPLYFLREKNDGWKVMGALFKSVVISAWVAWMLDFTLGVPFEVTWYWILVGDGIAVVGLGFMLYKSVKKVAGLPGLQPHK